MYHGGKFWQESLEKKLRKGTKIFLYNIILPQKFSFLIKEAPKLLLDTFSCPTTDNISTMTGRALGVKIDVCSKPKLSN
jgi:hypothetical protein